MHYRTVITLIVIMALLGLGLLSAFAMSPMTMGDHDTSGTCLAATAAQTPCPAATQTNDFGMINLHSDFIAGFAKAIANTSLLLLMSLLSLLWLVSERFSLASAQQQSTGTHFAGGYYLIPALAVLRAWQSLLEHSPTFAVARL